MEKDVLLKNAKSLENEYNWLKDLIEVRFQLHFEQPGVYEQFEQVTPPDLTHDASMVANFIRHYNMGIAERVVLLLALAPHIMPQVLDPFFTKNTLYNRGFTEFGGITGQNHGGFLPTGETALFLLAGDDVTKRIELMALFDEEHYFFRHNILKLDSSGGREPFLSGALFPSLEYLAYFTDSKGEFRPKFSAQFPAKRIETKLDWQDLVLNASAMEEIGELLAWLEHKNTIMHHWQLNRLLKPGYRALFYGPPGTGKTMTAALLGKSTGLEVYRIDLSQVVSKFIGETEKNLAGIFDRAENSNWILFFDEADALFGKRTSTKDSNDRYANQEVAYLLQRIEDFPGVAILATNLKSNIDDAFTRRFQSMVYFPMPNYEQRLKLWKKAFTGKMLVADDVDWETIAQQYEMAGGSIINVLQYCALSAVRRDPPVVSMEDILHGIRKELRKEGKTQV